MNQHEGEKYVRDHVKVSPVDVAAAKAWFARTQIRNTRGAIEQWLDEQGFAMSPPSIPLGHDDDEATLNHAARNISLQLAAEHAIWGLVYSGSLFAGPHILEEIPQVHWQHQTGQGASWRFEEYRYSFPASTLPSMLAASRHSDGDLFLANVGVTNLDPGVAEALEDSAACLRHDLYTPSVAMLGAAVEGAWIELGKALLPYYEAGSSGVGYRKALFEPTSITKKVDTVKKMWGLNPLKNVRDACGISIDKLDIAAAWTDTVRRSRNVLHWDNEPETPNNYDKVASLMLTAPSHFQVIYGAKRAAADGAGG